eukprot:5391625-Amphidinium_carterae.1
MDRAKNLDTSLAEVIHNSVLGKAPSTVMARAKAVHNFVVWVRSCGGEVTAVEESDAFLYCKHLASQRSFTAVQSFTSALNFGAFVLGWDGAAEAANSPRVKGLMQSRLVSRPAAKQAAPLTVDQVATLEET